jgi:diacylglycerol O-acyltransferase
MSQPKPIGFDDGAVALSAAETAFVRYQQQTGHSAAIGLLAMFGGAAPRIGQLREHLEHRLTATAELHWTLRGTDRGDRLVWAAGAAIDWEDRVRERHCDTAISDTVADVFARRLDPGRDPWRWWLLHDGDRGWALLLQVHHALADGVSIMELMRRALGANSAPPTPPARNWAPSGVPSRRSALAILLRHGPSQLREFVPSMTSEDQLAHAPVRFGWETVGLQRLRTHAAQAGATVNDVVLAAITGVLAGLEKISTRPRCVYIPISTRAASAASSLGNQVTGVHVRLPYHHCGLPARIATIAATTTQLKHSGRIRVAWAADRVLPSWLFQRVFDRALCGRNAAPLISNWGVSAPLSHRGEPAQALVPVMFRPGGHRLAVAFATHRGRTHIGFATTDDPERLRTQWRNAMPAPQPSHG